MLGEDALNLPKVSRLGFQVSRSTSFNRKQGLTPNTSGVTHLRTTESTLPSSSGADVDV